MAGRTGQMLVIGGGAAGFFGAIACAELSHAPVVLFEAGRIPLTKVRISGGGRCNVTHACFDPALLTQFYPRGGKALRGALTRFQPKDTVTWFQQRGVALKTEADGRMFPVTDDSETIVGCLLNSALQAGVKLRTGAVVAGVHWLNPGFEVLLKSGERWEGDRLLLATGSNPQGYQIAQSLGHTIEPTVPSLFTFTIPEPDLRALAGVAVESVCIRLSVPEAGPLEQTGPVLITHWGLSGPAVLKLSAWGARLLHDHHYQASLTVNWLPGYQANQVQSAIAETRTSQGKRAIANHNPLPLPRRLWEYLVARAGIPAEQRWAELSKQHLQNLVAELTRGQFALKGKGTFKDEFVTCGGVSLKEVDFKTMESRLCPGLYFAGEILDIDGVTGGFNFQSAWTTGWIAGHAMAGIGSGREKVSG